MFRGIGRVSTARLEAALAGSEMAGLRLLRA